MRNIMMVGILSLLVACGGSNKRTAQTTTAPASDVTVPFASGPIANACLAADRRNASRKLCGCIQAVANQRLSAGEQSKAVAFFKDPHQAQVTRQSGASFWRTYKSYAASAERVCKAAA